MFDAFLSIYKARIADLLRIATGGTGVLPHGELHPDLVNRLAGEAPVAAGHVLNMCIRALDYCPPVDITFGDYLRALVTADRDLVPDDDLGYRVAVDRGVPPARHLPAGGAQPVGREPLLGRCPMGEVAAEFKRLLPAAVNIRRVRPDWSLSSSREDVLDEMRESCADIHDWLLCEEVQRPRPPASGWRWGRRAAFDRAEPKTACRCSRSTRCARRGAWAPTARR